MRDAPAADCTGRVASRIRVSLQLPRQLLQACQSRLSAIHLAAPCIGCMEATIADPHQVRRVLVQENLHPLGPAGRILADLLQRPSCCLLEDAVPCDTLLSTATPALVLPPASVCKK